MEPTDSRLQAAPPQNDPANAVFDMNPLHGDQVAAPPGPPRDIVPGVETSAELPLAAPAVHPPISQLEAALRKAGALGAQPATAPAAVPPPVTDVASSPPPPPAPVAAPAAPPVASPVAPPITEPTVDASIASAPPAPLPAAAAPEITVNVPAGFSLPAPNASPVGFERAPGSHAPASPRPITRLPMLPVRVVAVGGTALALAVSAWQAARVINEQERVASLSMLALLFAIVGAVGVVFWTWVVTENARRVVAPARTQEPPDPLHAAMTWVVPMIFIAGASVAVTYLSARLNTPSQGTESSFPLLLALASLVLALPLMYSPVTYLSGVVRKVGGRGIRFAEWISVPIVLSVVGVAMIAGLRFGGAFGEEFEGLAPAWVIGVAALVPTIVIVTLGWRAAAAVEADVGRAFDRRLGVHRALSARSSMFTSFSADGGPNHSALKQHGFITQLPGAHVLGVAIAAGLAGLGLLSLVGALIVFLFWQETRDGILLAAQSERAWELVALLHSLERNVALGMLALAALWSFLAVTNVRLASARRRNPILAAAAWPVAAGGVWVVADRWVADGSVVEVIGGFAAQALLLALPVFLLYRAAGSIGSRRQLLRIAWAMGVVLLVHVQGLGGLSTGDATLDSTQVAQLAGYLTIGALLQLFAMFAAAGAMRALTDTTSQVALRHNTLVEQRQQIAVTQTGMAAPPRIARREVSGAVAE